MMKSSKEISLNYEDHNIQDMWRQLQKENTFSDMTLACKDKHFEVHKAIISSCSPVLKHMLAQQSVQNPVIYLPGINSYDIEHLINFIYQGEINIPSNGIGRIISLADEFKIKGLTGKIDIFQISNKKSEFRKHDSDIHATSYTEKKKYLPIEKVDKYLPNEKVDKYLPNEKVDKYFPNEKVHKYLPNEKVDKYSDNKGFTNTSIKVGDEFASKKELKALEEKFKIKGLTEKFRIKGLTGKTDIIQNTKTSSDLVTPVLDGPVSSYSDKKTTSLKTYLNKKGSDKLSTKVDDNFASKNQLQNFNLDEPKKEKKLYEIKKSGLIQTSINNLQSQFCEVCGKNFKNTEILKSHLRKMHLAKPTFCDKCEFSTLHGKFTLDRHMESYHLPLQYNCDQCDYKFSTNKNRKRHVRVVHEKVQQLCDQCDHHATSLGLLKRHQEAIHQNVKYPCDQCEYKATSRGNLKVHRETIHEGVHHECHQCDFKTKFRRQLKVHIVEKHDGIRYPCKQCDYVALQNDNLHRHIKKRHFTEELLLNLQDKIKQVKQIAEKPL